jgi:hypothetical protein
MPLTTTTKYNILETHGFNADAGLRPKALKRPKGQVSSLLECATGFCSGGSDGILLCRNAADVSAKFQIVTHLNHQVTYLKQF